MRILLRPRGGDSARRSGGVYLLGLNRYHSQSFYGRFLRDEIWTL